MERNSEIKALSKAMDKELKNTKSISSELYIKEMFRNGDEVKDKSAIDKKDENRKQNWMSKMLKLSILRNFTALSVQM